MKVNRKGGRAAGRGGYRYEHYTCAWSLKADEEWQREWMARGVFEIVFFVRLSLFGRASRALFRAATVGREECLGPQRSVEAWPHDLVKTSSRHWHRCCMFLPSKDLTLAGILLGTSPVRQRKT